MRAPISCQSKNCRHKMADLLGQNVLAPGHFVQKQTVIFEENPKWRIYKGTFFCQIGPLSRDRARILYLIILWLNTSNIDFTP